MKRNEVVDANDAIASNHSRGTRMEHNRISQSGSGVHTDNAGDSAGSEADVLRSNFVQNCSANGFGVWVFVPYVAPTVEDNIVTHCSVGLALFGSGPDVTTFTSFTGNFVDGDDAAGSIGAVVSTSIAPYGSRNAYGDFSANDVRRASVGFALEQETGLVSTATLECNRITDNADGVAAEMSTVTLRNNAFVKNQTAVDATAVTSGNVDGASNYWNCPAGPPGAGCDPVKGNVDTSSPLSAASTCTAR